MAGLYDLPLKILTMIFQILPFSAILSTCLVSRYLHAASLPFLVSSFHVECKTLRFQRRLQSFLETIIRNNAGQYVKSVSFDRIEEILPREFIYLHKFLPQLSPQLPNIRQLAISGDFYFLSMLSDFPFQHLEELHCVESGPAIWRIIHLLPRLSLLSLRKHYCNTLQLPATNLPIKRILLDECNLDTESLCMIIRSCKYLVSLQYHHPLSCPIFGTSIPLNSRNIHTALLIHKQSLKELIVEDCENNVAQNETPKYGSFEDFPALNKLGVECNALDTQLPLPPSVRSVVIRRCDSAIAPDIISYLGRHPTVELIQFNYMDGGIGRFIQHQQDLGIIRKDIQVEPVNHDRTPSEYVYHTRRRSWQSRNISSD
ncbi:uncharacterized protein AKAW2_51796S [Aspergillus luchuensis]|uniref:F-box domain-containing protein n=1 Tax=Aspergillus kawachii TaxID=1069201 RepID=A0A7R7WF16_ASPKA|nr:uncharacterized protein AKAW2_51796S [Aspergillus luchuensis]BCS01455.1 hypothetical protein AKAW2_51796S [Aspergillus luchuensis]